VPYLGVDCIHGKQCPIILGCSQPSLFVGLTLPSGREGLYNVRAIYDNIKMKNVLQNLDSLDNNITTCL